LIVDFERLTDGIDGTLDRTDGQVERPGHVLVPAFRTRLSRTGVRLYRRLWQAVQESIGRSARSASRRPSRRRPTSLT